MKHLDAPLHVQGLSQFTDDVRPPRDMVHGVVFGSPVARGVIRALHVEEATASPGVVAVLTAEHIPGNPLFGPIIQDERLLAQDEVAYVGQPLAIVLAETRADAVRARALITAHIDEQEPQFDPRAAYDRGDIIGKPVAFAMGDVDGVWAQCAHVVEGSCSIGGQEHVPLETNRARAFPKEDGQMLIWSSTQSPYAVQRAAAKILGVPENKVEVDVKRLGGGFGGKEDQATHWAVMAAVAARHTARPIEIVLHREEDIRMTGKRHPYESDFKIGLDDDGLILAFEAKHFQNAGAFADLSMPVLERTLFHSTNAYFIPNVRVHAACCRTNLAPNTAFRGFGGPQGMFVIEAAIAKAADAMGLAPDQIQAKNLLRDGDELYYGQKTERCMMRRTWDEAAEAFDLESFRKRAHDFNAANFGVKKGFAVMPVCFGISFTKSFLNQAGALVHVYTDGSVSVTSGGIEMGQGLSTNLQAIAARTFGIDPARVKVEATNTTRVSNMSPSAASATTDLNGNAVIQAVREIRAGLLRVAGELLGAAPDSLTIAHDRVARDGKSTEIDWNRLVSEAYLRRRKLSAYGYYATPNLSFDHATNKGNAFAYHVYGTCITEVSLDCLRGIYTIDSVKVVHDLGRPINELVDLGQVEGGLMQGLGWMTMEDLVWDEKGRYTSGSLSTYKAPDVYFAPDDLDVRFLPFWENEPGPLGAKAVGEPPLMYGIGVYFALQSAIRAFAPDTALVFKTPMTPERALLALHPDWSPSPSADRS